MLRAGSLRPVLKAQQTPWRPSWRLRQVAPWRGCHISQALRSRLPVGSLLLLLLSRFSCVQLCDPIDGSPPGSAVPGILQARTLEWVAVSSSNAWKWKVKLKLFNLAHSSQALRSRLPVGSLLLLLLSRFSRVQLCDPMDCSLPGSSIHGIFQARVLEWGAIAFLHKHTQLLLRGSREPPAELPPRAGHEGSHIRVPYMVPTSLHPRGGTWGPTKEADTEGIREEKLERPLWCLPSPALAHSSVSSMRAVTFGCCLVTQLCPTLWDPMDCSPPGSSVNGISQARILEWVAISFSRGSSSPRDRTQVFWVGRRILCHWATWEPLQPFVWWHLLSL